MKKTTDRKVRENLKAHAKRMAELQAQGHSRLDASRMAYDELFQRKEK